mmetsp:Transcript_20780/g.49347  ORF Transcript_20780/g.49347 Transcript_20780/m.49347 type:complete len:870 (-) Transcript_20780:192-2801(-)
MCRPGIKISSAGTSTSTNSAGGARTTAATATTALASHSLPGPPHLDSNRNTNHSNTNTNSHNINNPNHSNSHNNSRSVQWLMTTATPPDSSTTTATTTTSRIRPRSTEDDHRIDAKTSSTITRISPSKENQYTTRTTARSAKAMKGQVVLKKFTIVGLPFLMAVALWWWYVYGNKTNNHEDSSRTDNVRSIVGALTVLLMTARLMVGSKMMSSSRTNLAASCPDWFSSLMPRWLISATASSPSKSHHGDRNHHHHPPSKNDYNSNNGPLAQLRRVTSGVAMAQFKTAIQESYNSFSSCSRVTLQAITHKQQCFVRADYIERLSINDVAILYRYAANMSHYCKSHDRNTRASEDAFDRTTFRNEQSEIVQGVITAIDMAVKVSRGGLADPTTTTTTSVAASTRSDSSSSTEEADNDDSTLLGGIDALYFVAVTRVFAEWRTLRLVPDGYQRYAVALGLGYRDILQNLEKMERGVHSYYRYHRSKQLQEQQDCQPIASPTIRELLEFELQKGVHSNLPYVAEKSAASGLLWAKRQLQYQVATLSNMLEVPDYYPSPKDAAQAAYKDVYQDYHGWTVKQVFSHSLNGSPPLDKIWTTMEPPTDLPKDPSKRRHTSSKPSTIGVSSKSAPYSHRHHNKPRTSKTSEPTINIQITSGTTSNASSFDEYDMPTRQLSDVTDHSSPWSVVDDSSMVRRLQDDEGENMDNEFLMALENFGHDVADKWDDFLRLFHCGKKEEKKKRGSENLILSRDSHFDLSMLQSSDIDRNHQSKLHLDRSNRNAVRTATAPSSNLANSSLSSSSYSTVTMMPPSEHDGNYHKQVQSQQNQGQGQSDAVTATKSKQDTGDFVHEMSPLLADLGELFDFYSMNDPSRV